MTNKRALYESIMARIQPAIASALKESSQTKKPELPFTDEEMQTREFKTSMLLFNDIKEKGFDVKTMAEAMKIISPDGKERYKWVSYKKIIPYLKKFDKLSDEQLKAI